MVRYGRVVQKVWEDAVNVVSRRFYRQNRHAWHPKRAGFTGFGGCLWPGRLLTAVARLSGKPEFILKQDELVSFVIVKEDVIEVLCEYLIYHRLLGQEWCVLDIFNYGYYVSARSNEWIQPYLWWIIDDFNVAVPFEFIILMFSIEWWREAPIVFGKITKFLKSKFYKSCFEECRWSSRNTLYVSFPLTIYVTFTYANFDFISKLFRRFLKKSILIAYYFTIRNFSYTNICEYLERLTCYLVRSHEIFCCKSLNITFAHFSKVHSVIFNYRALSPLLDRWIYL